MRQSVVRLLAAALVFPVVLSQNITDAQLDVVIARLAQGATHPWELGTRAQALLEHNVTEYSVFSQTSLPPPAQIPSNLASVIAPVISIAHDVVANRSASNANATGPQPLVADDSAADPASIGVAVLIANWTGQGAVDGLDYAGAARDQLDFLMQKVPSTPDGAISHRTGYVQLWSDFVYMVPPFLAYYGMVSHNRTLMLEGYNQIKLYRSYLRDPSAGNMWKHVLLGPYSNDPGHWSTGNGWAAAGMLRVLATIQRSQYANTLKSQQTDLANWVQEIHNGIYPYLDQTDVFKNYPDQDLSNDSSTVNFYDSSSTALLASTVYRLALLWKVHKHLPFAERSRITLSAAANTTNILNGTTSSSSSPKTSSASSSHSLSSSSTSSTSSSTTASSDGQNVRRRNTRIMPRVDADPSISSSTDSSSATPTDSSSSSSSSTSSSSTSSAPSSTPTAPSLPGLAHFTSEGWLTPVVNPDSYGSIGSSSPEGQAFIVEMQAAWSDWVAQGSPGANGAMRGNVANVWLLVVVGAVAAFVTW